MCAAHYSELQSPICMRSGVTQLSLDNIENGFVEAFGNGDTWACNEYAIRQNDRHGRHPHHENDENLDFTCVSFLLLDALFIHRSGHKEVLGLLSMCHKMWLRRLTMPIYTPWKKSRKFGDIYGGRERLKCSDNIFQRLHSIKRPNSNDVLPILIEDNPSRDFFFPLSGQETLETLRGLPKRDYEEITHVWLRRLKKTDYTERKLPFAWFCCGSGVRAIVLFPWPNDLTIPYGSKRPSNKVINEFERYGAKLEKNGKNWVS